MTNLDGRLSPLPTDSECRLVESVEFCKLILSRKRLQRSDQPATGLRELLDLETGTRFMIEEQKLFGRCADVV